MQNINVNAESVQVLKLVKEAFEKADGIDGIKLMPDGVVKLKTNYIYDAEFASIAHISQWVGVEIRRSDKNVLVLFTPKEPVPETISKAPRVRDFYDKLPEDQKVAAFKNTAQNKWDLGVRNLTEAILSSFYLNHSPEGTEYWQDVILENII